MSKNILIKPSLLRKFGRNIIGKTLAYVGRELHTATNDFAPCHLTQLWQIVITDAVFDEAVDDAGIEIIAGANCTDRCQRLHVIMYFPIFRV